MTILQVTDISYSFIMSSDRGPQGPKGNTGDVTSGESTLYVNDVVTKGPSVDVHASPFNAVGDGVTDDTAAFTAAIAYLAGLGGGELLVRNKTYNANITVNHDGISISGRSMGSTVFTSSNASPTLTLKKDDGTPLKTCNFQHFTVLHTGTGGGILMNGRENTFNAVKVASCTGYGLKFENNLSGGGLNEFVNCQFYRNGGLGGIIIPANDASGYANGNMFTNCWFDRYGDNVPTIDCGTSMTINGGWLQGRDYAGIKVRTSSAAVRATNLRIDSTSVTHILVEFADGATPDNVKFSGVDIDGQYYDGVTTKHGATLNGSTETTIDADGKVARYFKSSEHETFDFGGVREDGVKIGINRVFWTSDSPDIAFPTRTHLRGDIAFRSNTGTTVNNIYLCTASGTPGTWEGFVRRAPAMADSTAIDVATLKTDFNTLLAGLRTAGIMST